MAEKPFLLADPSLGMEGRPELLSFSASMHGFHATLLDGYDEADQAAAAAQQLLQPDAYLQAVLGTAAP